MSPRYFGHPTLLPRLLLLALGAAPPSSAELTIRHLRCEYLVEPLAIEVREPRLSWVIESEQRAQSQTHYRILAASNPEKLGANTGDLWDTGKVRSDETAQIAYAGKPLGSRQRIYWKVRAWDPGGIPSPWSEPTSWSMGLLAPSDWQASWIGDPGFFEGAMPFRNGFHSRLDKSPDAVKWVVLDLGERRRLNAVRLFPARPFDWKPDTTGFLFPLRFRVEIADEAGFGDARTVLDHTTEDVVNPLTEAPSYTFNVAEGRYVRLTVTRQRRRDGDDYGFALAEMQVLHDNRVLSGGASATASDSNESASWSTAFLTDGDLLSHAGTRPDSQPATLLRKDFELRAGVKRAVVYASALGLYELRLNGHRVGNRLLAPEWTDYHRRVQFQTYDVTALLRPESNTLGVALGEGWYAGRVGMSDGLHGRFRGVYGKKPWFLGQLEVELENGQRLLIASDASWQATKKGPVRQADLLDGESYSAANDLGGWDRPGYAADDWSPVVARTPASFPARLVAQPNEPIRVVDEIAPVLLSEPTPGVYVFDLGQNIVGRCRLNLPPPCRNPVTLRHAEMTNESGLIYTNNLRGALQVDRYTPAPRSGAGVPAQPDPVSVDGKNPPAPAPVVTHEPSFTQHGFRFVEVTGLEARPKLEDLTGVVFNSAALEVGGFECSSALLNRLWWNILWTQRANLMSTPTDCPQRDERLGWMGDIQAFAQTGMFNMDLAAFFTKWLRDVRDAQANDGRFPDFAPHPYDPNTRFSGAPAWADAGVIVPWRCYENYGDRRILEENFESAKHWIQFVRRHNPDLIWRNRRGNDYNDWLNGDRIVRENWPKEGAEIPREVFATAFFTHSTELVARMASVLDRDSDAAEYGDLSRRIKAAFNREFVTAEGRIEGNTQAGYALALHFDLLPDRLRPLAAKHLAEGVKAYGDHLSTGIQSTIRALLALTEAGYDEPAWELVTDRSFPSWGYMIENGATTIWERWDGYVKGRGFQDPGMNSFNHWAFGAVGEWMIRHILGINPDANHPGWKRFGIGPRPGSDVTWARGHYDSIRGRIAVAWRLEPSWFHLDLNIPANTTAEVTIPAPSGDRVLENERPAAHSPGVRFLRHRDGLSTFEVQSGAYAFKAPRN